MALTSKTSSVQLVKEPKSGRWAMNIFIIALTTSVLVRLYSFFLSYFSKMGVEIGWV